MRSLNEEVCDELGEVLEGDFGRVAPDVDRPSEDEDVAERDQGARTVQTLQRTKKQVSHQSALLWPEVGSEGMSGVLGR